MKEIRVKDVVDNNKRAKLTHAIAGRLYYRVDDEERGTAYQFCVDMNDKEDVGTATFVADEKAIMLMRYINKSKISGDLIQIR